MIDARPICVRFDKVDGLIRVYASSRYLALFGLEKYDVIYNRIRYLISRNGGISYVFSHSYTKIKTDSYNSLPLQKTLTLHNVIIHIKSVLNKSKSPLL